MLLQILISKSQLLWLLIVLITLAVLLLLWRRQQASGEPIPARKVALYATGVAFVALFLFGEPLFRALVYTLYGVDERIIGPNASSQQVLADHVIGGWVQVGTLLSKLFAANSFYVTSYTLPWLLQRTTHPEPTRWAKDDYSREFAGLLPVERFHVYGNIQFNQSIRIAASLLAAALLV